MERIAESDFYLIENVIIGAHFFLGRSQFLKLKRFWENEETHEAN